MRTRKVTRSWGQKGLPRGYSRPRILPVLSGPKRASVFSVLRNIWPEGARPARAYVVSPFFDPPNVSNIPARELWKLLRSRSSRLIQYEVTAEEVNGSGRKQLLLHAPCTLKQERPPDPDAEVRFQSLELDCARSLHAKCLWLESANWTLYLMGSSNFTRAGLGLGRAVNLEANLAYLVCHGQNWKALWALESAWMPSTPVSRNFRLLTEPLPENGEDAPAKDQIVLPEAFAEAVLTASKKGNLSLELTFGGRPPRGWVLLQEDKEKRVYSEREWLKASRKGAIRLSWADPKPPSALRVRWADSNGCAWWPVNVACGNVLPAPEQLRTLDLEDLVEILTASAPLHKALDRLLRRKKRGEGKDHEEIDPHRRVDTSQFLLQRTRRITWALAALRQRIEQPVPSQEALNWRLNGPVGVMALATAIIREARSTQEKCFLLAELALELARVSPVSAPGCLPRKEIRTALRLVIRQLRAEGLQSALGTGSIRKYAARAFKEAVQT